MLFLSQSRLSPSGRYWRAGMAREAENAARIHSRGRKRKCSPQTNSSSKRSTFPLKAGVLPYQLCRE